MFKLTNELRSKYEISITLRKMYIRLTKNIYPRYPTLKMEINLCILMCFCEKIDIEHIVQHLHMHVHVYQIINIAVKFIYSPEIPNQDTAISTTKPDKLEDKTDSVKATDELKGLFSTYF
jgi:hypothetical protein